MREVGWLFKYIFIFSNSFLERNAITRAQYEKSLHDLRVKMGETEEEAQ